MSTRSAIGVMHGDKAKVVYCHWDGYLGHNGRILMDHYDSPKANFLVALGNLSSLKASIGEKHDFDDRRAGDTQCTFYGRDRGEEGNEYTVCHSAAEMYEHFDWCEYFYIMRDGVWYVSQGPDTEWKELAVALAELDIENAEYDLPAESVLIKHLVGA